jgi:nitrile hydratase
VDGIHDLGGMQGFGPVEIRRHEPVFHHQWEGRVFGLVALAVGASVFNGPMFRHAIERMEPAHYLASSYYEHWLTALATLLVESGMISREELARRAGCFPLSYGVLARNDVEPVSAAARFAVGDPVRVRDVQFAGHTRCPRYVRGRRGVVVRIDPAAPVPEIEAHFRQQVRESIYCVRFAASALWGADADRTAAVHVDLYDRYLEAVAGS